MRQSVEQIRKLLLPATDLASDSLRNLLKPIGYQYRHHVIQSFESEIRALPFALQEVAPDETTQDDLVNITFSISLICYYRSIIIPLEGARRFASRLEKVHGITDVRMGRLNVDKSSRKSMEAIVHGFQAMIARMGIPASVLFSANTRDAIRAYFGELTVMDELADNGDD